MGVLVRIVAACLVVLSAGASAQDPAGAVRLVPRFVEGRPVRYRIEYRSEDRERAPAGAAAKVIQTVELRATPARVAKDGSAHVRVAFDRVRIELEWSGEKPGGATWDWGRGGDGRAKGTELPGFEGTCRALSRSVIELELDAAGWVHKVSGLDRAWEASVEVPEHSAGKRALGLFDAGGTDRDMALLWSLGPGDGAVAEAEIGKTWEVVIRSADADKSTFEARTTYRLDGVADAAAQISGTTAYAFGPAPGAPGSPPPLRIAEQRASQKVTWDLGAGRLRDRRFERELVFTGGAAGGPDLVSSNIIEITCLEPPPKK